MSEVPRRARSLLRSLKRVAADLMPADHRRLKAMAGRLRRVLQERDGELSR